MNEQNNRERLMDQLSRGLITADQANVQMVRNERVRLVTKLSREDRNALNKAVKEKKLGHLKKDGMKPEAYFHPDFDFLARSKRNAAMDAGIRALKSVCI